MAPGWLDADVKILKPENVTGGGGAEGQGGQEQGGGGQDVRMAERRTSVGIKGLMERRDGVPDEREGEALDRAFGGLDLK